MRRPPCPRAAPAPCTGTSRGSCPSCVSPCCVGSDVRADCGAGGAIALARPKSRSFTPDFVSITLPGFRSRCTIPCRCALSSASAICDPNRTVWSSDSAPLLRRSVSVSPSRYSMTRYSVSPSRPDVVERADVRMRELRDRFRLALEALADLGRRRHVRRQHFHRDRPLQPRVLRLVDLSHPAGAERRQDLVGTQARSGGERHFFSSAAVQFVTSVIGESSCGGPECTRNFLPSLETS